MIALVVAAFWIGVVAGVACTLAYMVLSVRKID